MAYHTRPRDTQAVLDSKPLEMCADLEPFQSKKSMWFLSIDLLKSGSAAAAASICHGELPRIPVLFFVWTLVLGFTDSVEQSM